MTLMYCRTVRSTGEGTFKLGRAVHIQNRVWCLLQSPYSEDFGYSDGTGSTANPDLPDCWEHAKIGSCIHHLTTAYVD